MDEWLPAGLGCIWGMLATLRLGLPARPRWPWPVRATAGLAAGASLTLAWRTPTPRRVPPPGG